MNLKQIAGDCEKQFQNGAGRVQVRDSAGLLVRSSHASVERERKLLESDESLWQRTKRGGVYVWQYVHGGAVYQ